MGHAAEPLGKIWATHFAPGVVAFDAARPANDTAPPAQLAEIPRYKWIHCANEGLYRGHHQGEFDLTPAVFESFVKNLREHPQYRAGSLNLANGVTYTGGTEPVLQFDYEHASECPPWEGEIPKSGAPACAWVLDLELRRGADGKAQLWAFAELLDTLREQIRLRQQRWVSIAFALQSTHWITKAPMGPCLTSIAITNHPFMLDLLPLAASRRTSQPGNLAVGSASDSSEAPDGQREPTRTGATMESPLRERICKALKIQKLADDAAVGDAVDAAVAGNSNLSVVLDALGVPLTGEALKVIPQLRDAQGKLQAVLKELNDLLSQEQAADAAIATQDVGAAMKAGGLGEAARKSLAVYRNSLIAEERAKLEADAKKKDDNRGDIPQVAVFRTALTAGRKRFLEEHGVKDAETAHLSTTLVAGAGGAQLDPPKGGTPRTIEQSANSTGAPQVIDLREVEGVNATLRLAAWMRKNETGFAALSREKQIKRVSEFRKTVELQLE